MDRPGWKGYLGWVLFTEAVGGISGWLAREGVQVYNETVLKPPLSPPSWVFPVVWVLLFALMGIGGARVARATASSPRTRGLFLFLLQLAFNFFWSILFFGLQAFGPAFVWLVVLWLLIWAMIRVFRQVDPLAGMLQVPYLLWVAFAGYLNLGVWVLNR